MFFKSNDIIHWKEKPFTFPWFGFMKKWLKVLHSKLFFTQTKDKEYSCFTLGKSLNLDLNSFIYNKIQAYYPYNSVVTP